MFFILLERLKDNKDLEESSQVQNITTAEATVYQGAIVSGLEI